MFKTDTISEDEDGVFLREERVIAFNGLQVPVDEAPMYGFDITDSWGTVHLAENRDGYYVTPFGRYEAFDYLDVLWRKEVEIRTGDLTPADSERNQCSCGAAIYSTPDDSLIRRASDGGLHTCGDSATAEFRANPS